MVIPVGPEGDTQYLEQHDKLKDGTIVKKKLMGVIYVPLTSREKQLPGVALWSIESMYNTAYSQRHSVIVWGLFYGSRTKFVNIMESV